MKKYSLKIATTCDDNNVFQLSNRLVINKEVLAKHIVTEVLLHHQNSLSDNTLRYLDAINNLKENELKPFVKHFIKISKTLHNALNSVYGRIYHSGGGNRVYSNYSATKKSDIKTWNDKIVLYVDLFIDNKYTAPVIHISQATLLGFPKGGKLCDCVIGGVDSFANYTPNYDTFNKVQRILYPHLSEKTINNIQNNTDKTVDKMNDYDIKYTIVTLKNTSTFNATLLLERIIKLITKINDMVSLNTGTVTYGNITTTISNPLTLQIIYTKNFVISVKRNNDVLLSVELNSSSKPVVEDFLNNFYYHQAPTKITI